MASFLIICAIGLNFGQLWSLNLLLLEPDYRCQETGSSVWVSCSREEACTPGIKYKFDYGDRGSFTNFYEQMNLTCEDDEKILMVPAV